MPQHADAHTPDCWLAFELSVLRRLRFASIALPCAGAPACALQLKRWGAQVHANYDSPAGYISGVAHVANNRERLTTDDIDRLSADLYVPRHRLAFPQLRSRFDEPAAWWFSNLRERIAQIEDRTRRALAFDLALRTARYSEAFDDTTSYLRSSLTEAMQRIWANTEPPVDNNHPNACTLRFAHEFLAEQRADLALIRLPRFARRTPHAAQDDWQTNWIGDEFRTDAATPTASGNAVPDDSPRAAHRRPAFPAAASKRQYLRALEELLARAAHLPQWAIVHVADGSISDDDFVGTIRRVRAIKTIYTKDFSEWTGARVHIIVA